MSLRAECEDGLLAPEVPGVIWEKTTRCASSLTLHGKGL